MDSRTYWKNREEEQRKKNIRDEAEYAREIQRIYANMMDEIQKEINGFYTRYAKKEGITIAEAKKRVSQMDIDAYSRKAEKYVKDKDFSKEANEEMRLYNVAMKINRLEMLKANIGMHLVGGFDELQKYFDQILTERTLEEFERQAGILGKSIQDNAKAAHAIVNASFHNAKYSDRIWMYQDMMKAELSKLLQTGLIQGKNPRVLARHLSKLFGVGRKNAERLMVTELSRVQGEAQKQSYIRNGFEEYEFIAEPTACPVCSALDGKHFKVEKMMPGENAQPMHPNCRCSTAAHMDDDEYNEWLDGYSEHGLSFEEWKKLKKNGKSVAKRIGFGIMKSGARILDPESKQGIAFAKMYYAEIRSFSTDSEKIAKNTGKSKAAIEKIKEYLFFNDSFEPDCAIAQSWQRLMNGTDIKKHDKTLIEHELYEMDIKENNKNISHSQAHTIATKKYDYQGEVDEYYGNLKKNKEDK